MRETEAAARALVDYIARATDPALSKEEKTLEGLADFYRAATGDIPTTSLATLKKWSTEHEWQSRLDTHVAETNAETLRRMKTDMAGVRVRRLKLVAKALVSIESQIDHKVPVDPKDLTKLIETEAKLYGEPLADRTEITGARGGPVQVARVPIYAEEDPLNHIQPEAEDGGGGEVADDPEALGG